MLYVLTVPAQTGVLPEIVPGCAGMTITVTLFVLSGPDPHRLFAYTDIVPPDVPAVAFIEVVVELPVHPAGNVHVYDVAPVTAGMLYVFVVPEHTGVFPEIVPG
jgi:hypothetical protein